MGDQRIRLQTARLVQANDALPDAEITFTGKTYHNATFSGLVAGGPFDVWSTFTPVLTQNVTVTCSIATGRYIQIGKVVLVNIRLVASSAGTAANGVNVAGLPIAPQSSTPQTKAGSGFFWRSPNLNHNLEAAWLNNTTVQFWAGNGATTVFGGSPAVTLASGDELNISLLYESLF